MKAKHISDGYSSSRIPRLECHPHPMTFAEAWGRRAPYFLGKSGRYWRFSAIKSFIAKHRKDLFDKPALIQIRKIGLGDEFDGGLTRSPVAGHIHDYGGA